MPVSVRIADKFQKYLLGYIISFCLHTGVETAETIDMVIIFFYDHAKGFLIPILYLPDQFPVLHLLPPFCPPIYITPK